MLGDKNQKILLIGNIIKFKDKFYSISNIDKHRGILILNDKTEIHHRYAERISIVKFVWRDLVAEYNIPNMLFSFNYDELYQVPWKDHPEDAIEFINWLTECTKHQEEYVSSKYMDNHKIYPCPYTKEFC